MSLTTPKRPSRSSSRSSAAHPPAFSGFSQDVLTQFDGLGRRLASDIRALIGMLPVGARSVRSMAAYLEVNRNLCQRAIAAANSTLGGIDVVSQSPGFSQLLVLVNAAEAKKVKPSVVKSLRVAVQEVADLAVKVSGSEAKFRSELRTSMGDPGGSHHARVGDIGHREALFGHAREIAGSGAELRANVGIVWPSESDPNVLDLTMVVAYHSHVCREGGMPLTAYFHESRDFESEAHNHPDRAPYTHTPNQPQRALLHRFCSTPLPVVTPHGPKDLEHHVVDPSAYQGNRAIDVATLHQTHGVPHPATRPDDPLIDVLAHVSIPVRRFIFDFYLHRSLARQCIPFFGAFALGSGIEVAVRNAWYRQLPEGGQLELLGSGTRHIATKSWHRHEELVRHAFDSIAVDPSDAIGFRADIRFPVWGMTYAIGFDFSGAGAPILP